MTGVKPWGSYCRAAFAVNPGVNVNRKVGQVQLALDPRGISELPDEEIQIIVRAADELIFEGGRSLLARVLKGSRQNAALEHELDRSPAYSALSKLSLDEITARIDWMILNAYFRAYFRIEYDYRLPLLVYGKRGLEIERETDADKLPVKLTVFLAIQNWFFVNGLLEPVLTGDPPINTLMPSSLAQLAAKLPDV